MAQVMEGAAEELLALQPAALAAAVAVLEDLARRLVLFAVLAVASRLVVVQLAAKAAAASVSKKVQVAALMSGDLWSNCMLRSFGLHCLLFDMLPMLLSLKTQAGFPGYAGPPPMGPAMYPAGFPPQQVAMGPPGAFMAPPPQAMGMPYPQPMVYQY
eukprot:CAMPEP_0197650204 /NCGR_PEP_ID=MMETSP1338-20131121/30799_1 /TAXON_ID=43686 ORGANISM="Pelagodinium beii, Strain RCC1491" /NCGR_SAMPLE_ID=MMETSP1338 /ASSEMBLY_ACC=CAM_ASM_000754 /LENGTH=156 /DNA_ID=CAMNT_0043224557 /DNA_START=69 /DNA_END=542 /DNA_ORIENTATION=-